MSIKIEKKGILDTFQDLGRKGHRRSGINPGGAMDRTAVRLINILLGNPEHEAALEMHFPAPRIVFGADAVFALGGADLGAHLNERAVENWRVLSARQGDSLEFTAKKLGSRCYMAVKGGFELEEWLGSKSTDLKVGAGGLEGRRLENGDVIDFAGGADAAAAGPSLKLSRSLVPRYSNAPTVRITAGAEYADLTALSGQHLLAENFRVTADSDRMGFRLEGRPLHLLGKKELVSTAVDLGTIQLLPDGQMVVLMADHQTTGGYPRIAHVIEHDLPLVAQLGAGDSLGFHLVKNREAEELTHGFENDLALLRTGMRLARAA